MTESPLATDAASVMETWAPEMETPVGFPCAVPFILTVKSPPPGTEPESSASLKTSVSVEPLTDADRKLGGVVSGPAVNVTVAVFASALPLRVPLIVAVAADVPDVSDAV